MSTSELGLFDVDREYLAPHDVGVLDGETPQPADAEDADQLSSGRAYPRAEGPVPWGDWTHVGLALTSYPRVMGTTSEEPVLGTSDKPKIRVYLLDDHEIVRRGLKDLLEGEGDIEVVGDSGLAQEAIRRIPALRPDVAVLDGRLPDGSGIDVCREIRSRCPHTAALILTSFDDDEALFSAIMAGASGYVLKQVRGNDLLETVRRVASGQSTLDPAVTQQVLDRLRHGPEEDVALAPLTTQERRILELIGEGMTNRQIAEAMFLAEKTIKNYVSALLAKLGFERRTQAAVFAAKHLP